MDRLKRRRFRGIVMPLFLVKCASIYPVTHWRLQIALVADSCRVHNHFVAKGISRTLLLPSKSPQWGRKLPKTANSQVLASEHNPPCLSGQAEQKNRRASVRHILKGQTGGLRDLLSARRSSRSYPVVSSFSARTPSTHLSYPRAMAMKVYLRMAVT